MLEKCSELEMSEIVVVAASNYARIGELVAAEVGVEVCPTEQKTFPNGELYARLDANVRNKEVFVVASHVDAEIDVNGAIMQSLLLVDAAKHASAKEINLVLPFMAYQRQDRRAKPREALGSRILRHAIEEAGAHRIMTVDTHNRAVESGYDIPIEQLTAFSLLADTIRTDIGEESLSEVVVVAPDAGALKTNKVQANRLNVPHTIIEKWRDPVTSQVERSGNIEGVVGKICCIFDDMIDTGGTIVSGAKLLKESGASQVIVAATHGIFSHQALEKLQDPAVDKLYVTDTFPTDHSTAKLGDKLKVVSVAPIIGQAILAIHRGESVSAQFDGKNYR